MTENQRRLAMLGGALAMTLVAVLPWPGAREGSLAATGTAPSASPSATARLSAVDGERRHATGPSSAQSQSSGPPSGRRSRHGAAHAHGPTGNTGTTGTTASPRPDVPLGPPARRRCVTDMALDHPDLASGRPRWVAFCGVDDPGSTLADALVPETVLTSGVRPLLASWRGRLSEVDHSCPMLLGAAQYSIQVGFADHTVAQLTGYTGACAAAVTSSGQRLEDADAAYGELATAIAEQAAAAVAQAAAGGTGAAAGLTCPTGPDAAVDANTNGGSGAVTTDHGPPLTLPAVSGLVCRYDADGAPTGQTTLDADAAERLRLHAGSSTWNRTCCQGPNRGPGSAVALLADDTGTVRAETLEGRHRRVTLLRGVPATPERLGFAGSRLWAALTGQDS